MDIDEGLVIQVYSINGQMLSAYLGAAFVCLTLLLYVSLRVFSRVNISTLFSLSWNMREPRLEGRFSSSIIRSLGTLIFFPRFSLSETEHTQVLTV